MQNLRVKMKLIGHSCRSLSSTSSFYSTLFFLAFATLLVCARLAIAHPTIHETQLAKTCIAIGRGANVSTKATKSAADFLCTGRSGDISTGASANDFPEAPHPLELDRVASGITVADYLQLTWGTGAIPPHEDDIGAFRFLCSPSHLSYDDPIVFPGQPGKSHLHQWFGNTLANANSTYESLRRTGESTCNNLLNRSAYWIPALMNGSGKVVRPDYLVVYYKRMRSVDPRCHILATACVPLPRGLRYIFGYNMLNPASTPITDASKYQRWWNCDGPSSGLGHYATITDAVKHCVVGERLGAVLLAPDCWNGKDLDSPDHRSHMAYRTYKDGSGRPMCPKGYPFIIPQFQLGAWYTTDTTMTEWYLSSDRMTGMPVAEPGSTIHADWLGAWEDSILDLWTNNCIEKLLSCSGGDLGNGTQLKTMYGYDYPKGRPLVDPPSK